MFIKILISSSFSFQTLISTEATDTLIQEGYSKGRTLHKRREVGSLKGPGIITYSNRLFFKVY